MAQSQQPPPDPEPQAAPPQPMSTAVLKVLKTKYNNYIAAGGTPPIYNPTPPSQDTPIPPSPTTITIHAVPSPATSPVTVTGTIYPSAPTDVAVFRGPTLIVNWAAATVNAGAWTITLTIPTGAAYTVSARQHSQPQYADTSNTFNVS